MDHHSYSFFGQKTGLILDSSNICDPYIYFRFIKKKESGIWEKPSQKEGKNIKINILELIQIINILSRQNSKWSTIHKFEEDSTSINFSNNNGIISFSINGYAKQIKYPESKLLIDLLHHIYQEKIENLSSFNNPSNNILPIIDNPKEKTINQKKYDLQKEISSNNWIDGLKKDEEFVEIPGNITDQSGKAISFQILGYNQIWIPLSCIKNNESINRQEVNKLWIKEWFVKKKIDDIFAIVK